MERLERGFQCESKLAASKCGLLFEHKDCVKCVTDTASLRGSKNRFDAGCTPAQINRFCSKPRNRVVPINSDCWTSLLASPFDQCPRGAGDNCSACVLNQGWPDGCASSDVKLHCFNDAKHDWGSADWTFEANKPTPAPTPLPCSDLCMAYCGDRHVSEVGSEQEFLLRKCEKCIRAIPIAITKRFCGADEDRLYLANSEYCFTPPHPPTHTPTRSPTSIPCLHKCTAEPAVQKILGPLGISLTFDAYRSSPGEESEHEFRKLISSLDAIETTLTNSAVAAIQHVTRAAVNELLQDMSEDHKHCKSLMYHFDSSYKLWAFKQGCVVGRFANANAEQQAILKSHCTDYQHFVCQGFQHTPSGPCARACANHQLLHFNTILENGQVSTEWMGSAFSDSSGVCAVASPDSMPGQYLRMLAGRRFLRPSFQTPHVETYTSDLSKAICRCNNRCIGEGGAEREAIPPGQSLIQALRTKDLLETSKGNSPEVRIKHVMHRSP
jgi:hypothetical protein